MNPVECFNIKLLSFDNNKSIFDLAEGDDILAVNSLGNCFDVNPTIIEADPFLFVFRGTLYLFYESKKLNDPACIKMMCTNNLETWSEPVVVLKEPFHLSFPFVFEDSGGVYMLPESGEDGTVRLYKAQNDNLSSFVLDKILLTDFGKKGITMSYADSCILKKDHTYFLFTTLRYMDCINTLELYCSDSLSGPYKEHPSSPIISSNKYGRNAGSILYFDNNYYRFSQDCTIRYGENINIHIIDLLTKSSYKESLFKSNIVPKDLFFFREGGHQFNAVRFCGKWIIAVDAKEYHQLFLKRIIGKLSRIVKH